VPTLAEEQRDAKRFIAPSERAQAFVIIDGEEHDAVMSDVSASGFGLLLFRGLRLPVGSVLRLVSDDSVHDCEVVHTRPEDSFQYVGVRRLTDAAMTDVSQFWFGQIFARNGSFACPFTLMSSIFCVLLGVLAVMLYFDINLFGTSTGTDGSGESVMALTSEERARAFEYRKEQARLRREALTKARRESASHQPSILDFFTRERRATRTLVGNRDLDWNDVTIELGLSEAQEKSMVEILSATGEDARQRAVVAKAKALKLLTSDQRARYRDLLSSSN
jgi:hypothetical protein